jgi:hypothetical protein
MTVDAPACIFTILEGNIQEFVLTEVSRRAVDELFDLTERNLQEALSRNDSSALTHPVLIDSHVGIQPLSYALVRLRVVMNKFPESRQGRIAIILPASPLIRNISMLMRPIAPMRVYTPQEREQAIAWLCSTMEAKR